MWFNLPWWQEDGENSKCNISVDGIPPYIGIKVGSGKTFLKTELYSCSLSLHPLSLLGSKSWWTALTSTVFLATLPPYPLFRGLRVGGGEGVGCRWGQCSCQWRILVVSWWQICLFAISRLFASPPNTMVGQVSLVSSANMTFQERSRICRKKPNCFKLLSELVQTPPAGRSAWEVLSHGLQL